jgi:hypothetical protein
MYLLHAEQPNSNCYHCTTDVSSFFLTRVSLKMGGVLPFAIRTYLDRNCVPSGDSSHYLIMFLLEGRAVARSEIPVGRPKANCSFCRSCSSRSVYILICSITRQRVGSEAPRLLRRITIAVVRTHTHNACWAT